MDNDRKENLPLSPIEQLQKSHNDLYKRLYEHYMALRRLLEHAIISIDASSKILLDAAEENQKPKDDG